jgi:hypothetical protein
MCGTVAMPATGTKSRIRLTVEYAAAAMATWSPLPDKRVAVRLALAAWDQANDAAAAGLVVTDHGLTQSFGHLLTDGARQDVGGTSGWKGDTTIWIERWVGRLGQAAR